MEASATTVNIEGPKLEKQTHSHKRNFGRYVADCSACTAKYPDGPPAKVARAPKAKAPTMSRDEIIALLKEHAPGMVTSAEPASQGDQLSQLIQLMMSKEAKSLLKEEAEEAQKQRSREDMVRIAREHEAQINANQAACSHTKENGRSAICQSQVHNDGFVHPFCQRCFKTFDKRRPSQEQMPTSVNA